MNDFFMLAVQLQWDFPAGLTVFQVDREKAVSCTPGEPMRSVDARYAMQWLWNKGGDAFGIAVRKCGGRMKGAFVEAYCSSKIDLHAAAQRRRTIYNAILKVIEKECERCHVV
jgi:hypothetical protein